MSGPGTLYLVATPIGNLEDITLRALRILKEVDRILCEDTRYSARLLTHFGITTRRESYHEHNEAARLPTVLELLRSGKDLALVTDAGTPLISDPGQTLVGACREAGIPVVPIPGPVAAMAALSGSGLATEPFVFAGFLDGRGTARRKQIQELASLPGSLILYEAPHRILAALNDLCAVLGPREACLARELTKVHEEWLRGTLPEIRAKLESRDRIEGEITLVIAAGSTPPKPPDYPASISEHVEREIGASGASRKEALRAVARQRGISRRDAYRMLLEERPDIEPHDAKPEP